MAVHVHLNSNSNRTVQKTFFHGMEQSLIIFVFSAMLIKTSLLYEKYILCELF